MKNKFIPQFKDGSGWDIEYKNSPYFYEHITDEEADRLDKGLQQSIYKITILVPLIPIVHKETYFVKGENLQVVLNDLTNEEIAAYIVNIEKVDKIPSFKEKLKNI